MFCRLMYRKLMFLNFWRSTLWVNPIWPAPFWQNFSEGGGELILNHPLQGLNSAEWYGDLLTSSNFWFSHYKKNLFLLISPNMGTLFFDNFRTHRTKSASFLCKINVSKLKFCKSIFWSISRCSTGSRHPVEKIVKSMVLYRSRCVSLGADCDD